jgi:hypothetical protein
MLVGLFCPMTPTEARRVINVSFKTERRSPRFSTQISTIRSPVGAEEVEPFDGLRHRRTERHEGSFGRIRSGGPSSPGFAPSLRIFNRRNAAGRSLGLSVSGTLLLRRFTRAAPGAYRTGGGFVDALGFLASTPVRSTSY